MTAQGQVITGRVLGRTYQLCPKCKARMVYGDPNPKLIWAGRLSLSEEQVSLLVIAAAEFDDIHRELSEAAVERGEEPSGAPSVVDFVDWMSVDALRDAYDVRYDHDGARGIDRHSPHRHPDPVPVVELPRSLKGLAR